MDGGEIQVGPYYLRFLQVPGNTLESICSLMNDRAPVRTPQEPAGMPYRGIHEKRLALPDDTGIFGLAVITATLCGF